MRLTRLQVHNWRNIEAAELHTDAQFVVLFGDNAQGKTNILEAVYYLAALRSFRERQLNRIVRHEQKAASIAGDVESSAGKVALSWKRTLVDSGRVISIDGAETRDLGSWFDWIRAILYCPEDNEIIRGQPEVRRRYIDRAAFTAKPGHLELVRSYRRVIRQKTALLRNGDGFGMEGQLDAWDEQLVSLGSKLAHRRNEIVEELSFPFSECVRLIGQQTDLEEVSLNIRGVGGAGQSADEIRQQLAEKLKASRKDEIRRKQALVGPHRDDLWVGINGKSARAFASQGQARTLVLALKLAEIRAAQERGETPVFLLDDLTSELDRGRMGRLIDLLGTFNNQVWITTTDPQHLARISRGSTQLIQVRKGQVYSDI